MKFGIGLRPTHYESIVKNKDRLPIDYFEIISEDFLIDGGISLQYLDRIATGYPLLMHGVSLSIGSVDPLNQAYLSRLKALMHHVKPKWISDHLCWTGVNQVNMHDLMPLPYTNTSVNHMVDRIKQVQDYLGRQILLENISSYITYRVSEMSEWEFLGRIVEAADCFILLDINNIYVNAFNHGFDPMIYIDALPRERVKQFHLAGHLHCKTHLVDTHDASVPPPVWTLYAHAAKRFNQAITIIERDANIPPLPELLDELNQARAIVDPIVECRVDANVT